MTDEELEEDVRRVLGENREGCFQWAGDGHWWVTVVIDHHDSDPSVTFTGEYECCSEDCDHNYGDRFKTVKELMEWARGFGPWTFLGDVLRQSPSSE